MSKLIDLDWGRTFHYLTVLERTENTKDGKVQVVVPVHLREENCGGSVGFKEETIPNKVMRMHERKIDIQSEIHTWDDSSSGIWVVWRSMKQRCMDPNHPAYYNYGGRGITVCQEWAESFERFWEDMGPTYQRGLELESYQQRRRLLSWKIADG